MSMSRKVARAGEHEVITDGLVLLGTTIGGEVGTFYANFTLWNSSKTESRTLRGLVDTGASYTLVPASILDDLGIARQESLTFRLADGSTQEFFIGLAEIGLAESVKSVYIVFGPENRILLGSMALEAFALAADAKNHRLVPADLTL